MFTNPENSYCVSYSVIIPNEGRAILLKRLLKSLRCAVVPINTEIEIIVVDSSELIVGNEIQEICREFDVLYLLGSHNVRQKRNHGARHSQHDYLLFLDSDCEASKDLFFAYTRFIQSNPDLDGILAAAGPTVFRGEEKYFTKVINDSSLLTPFKAPCDQGILLWTTTSNFLVSKMAFNKIHGFCEDFPFRLGGDDTDFGLRLHQAGCNIKTEPDAVVYHSWQTWASPLPVMKRSFRWGWMHAVLLKKHKSFRRWAPPGLPVYFFSCLMFSIIAAFSGRLVTLFMPLIFLLLAVVFHALFSAIQSVSFRKVFLTDLILALVECPFGFGKVVGSIANRSFTGIFYKIGIDDSEMNYSFSEMVNDLWSNNISLLIAIVIMVFFV